MNETTLNLYDLERQIELQLGYAECWIEDDFAQGGYRCYCRDAKDHWHGFVFERVKDVGQQWTPETFVASVKEMQPHSRPLNGGPNFSPYALALGRISAMLDVLHELGDTRGLERRNHGIMIQAREVRDLLEHVRGRFKMALKILMPKDQIASQIKGFVRENGEEYLWSWSRPDHFGGYKSKPQAQIYVTYSDGTVEPLVTKDVTEKPHAYVGGYMARIPMVRQNFNGYIADRAAAERLGTITNPRLAEKHMPGMELTAPILDKKNKRLETTLDASHTYRTRSYSTQPRSRSCVKCGDYLPVDENGFSLSKSALACDSCMNKSVSELHKKTNNPEIRAAINATIDKAECIAKKTQWWKNESRALGGRLLCWDCGEKLDGFEDAYSIERTTMCVPCGNIRIEKGDNTFVIYKLAKSQPQPRSITESIVTCVKDFSVKIETVAPQDQSKPPPAKGCACANPLCTWRGSFYCADAL